MMSPGPIQHDRWQGFIEYAAVTDIGMRRTNNQDSYSIVLASDVESWGRRGHIFVVADGMGAHAAGELASKMAADSIPHFYLKQRELPPWEALRRAIEQANEEVHARGRANLDFYNMGTTASALLLLPRGAIVGHVGDSRVYRQRGDRFEQLTFDHSLVWELQAAGHPGAAEPGSGIPKNIITRSLGPNPDVQVDLEGPFSLRPGDKFLLCSDGLTGQVTDEEIGTIVAALPPGTAAEVLVDLANLRGGPDNITVIIVEILREPPPEALAAKPPGTQAKSETLPAWFWLAVTSDLLLAVALAALGMYLPAALIGAGGIVALLAGGIAALVRSSSHSGLISRLGKGPYRSAHCRGNQSLVEKLDTIVRQLQEAAAENGWQVDLKRFDKLVNNAAKSAAHADYDKAIAYYGQAIRYVMQDLQVNSNDDKG